MKGRKKQKEVHRFQSVCGAMGKCLCSQLLLYLGHRHPPKFRTAPSVWENSSSVLFLNFKSFLKIVGFFWGLWVFFFFLNFVGFTHIKVKRLFQFCKDNSHAFQIF